MAEVGSGLPSHTELDTRLRWVSEEGKNDECAAKRIQPFLGCERDQFLGVLVIEEIADH